MAQEIRLYTSYSIEQSVSIILTPEQSHYLANVMRVKVGDAISIFNGRDGQWQAEITSIAKKHISVMPIKIMREQTCSPDLWLVFAPIKNKTELVVEKATELGVSKIIPVVTRHCVVRSVNMDKLTTHAIEASEQCERLEIPSLETHKDLSYLLGEWNNERILLYGDETGGGASLTNVLETLKAEEKKVLLSVLIGPEGGFASDELAMLKACEFAKGFGMGGRIMRADTAAISALACVQSQFGDWDIKPHFMSTY